MKGRQVGALVVALSVIECRGPQAPTVPIAEPLLGSVAPTATKARGSTPLRLCSWNLKKLGHGNAKDFGVVKAVIEENCDLAAIEEVMQKAGGHPGYEELIATLGDGWSGTITATPRPHTRVGHAEFYAAVWRPQKVTWCGGWVSLRYFTDNDGSPSVSGADRFSREPAYGCFRAVSEGIHGFDFLLGLYHATWEGGDSNKTAVEVRNLALVVHEMKQARAGENDVFVVGDFNLVPSKLAAATHLSDWTAAEGSTLNSRGERTSNLYDHVLVDDLAASPELQRKARVLDVRGKSVSAQVFERTVSDHLPVVVDVEVFRADDD